MLAKSGVYAIQCTYNGRLYVGSSVNMYQRCKEHKSYLKRNVHINKRLQRDYNRYGVANFVWLILEYVSDITDLISRESYWGDYLQAIECGYNVAPYGDTPMRYVGHSEATKRKIADYWTPDRRLAKSESVRNYWRDPVKRAEGLKVRRREDIRKRISITRTEYWSDMKNREHMSELKKGKSSPNKGRRMSDEQKRKIGLSNKARWLEKLSENER